MYLKNDRIVVTIKDTVFRSSRVAGLSGQFVLDPTALQGWTDGTSARRDTTPRPTSDGDFSEKATMASRLISISGTAIAQTRGELQRMRDQFTGLLADGGYTAMSVETSVDTRYSTVGLESTPSWVQHLDTVAVWKLDLYAPDPHIYGAEKVGSAGAYVVSGGLDLPLEFPLDYHYDEDAIDRYVTNNGNTISYPTFVVTGNYYSGFALLSGWGGQSVQFDGMVTMSSPVTIDMGRGTAIQNGVDKSTLISRRAWFGIPPQTTITPLFDPVQAGSGWCDIIYRDTWI